MVAALAASVLLVAGGAFAGKGDACRRSLATAEMGDVYCGEPNAKNRYVRGLYERLVAEGWKNLVYLPGAEMYSDDLEGTVDGVHPNDWGMMSFARAYGNAVKAALGLTKQAKLER